MPDAHEVIIDFTPVLDEGDGNGEYHLIDAWCSCGSASTSGSLEEAERWKSWHLHPANKLGR